MESEIILLSFRYQLDALFDALYRRDRENIHLEIDDILGNIMPDVERFRIADEDWILPEIYDSLKNIYEQLDAVSMRGPLITVIDSVMVPLSKATRDLGVFADKFIWSNI